MTVVTSISVRGNTASHTVKLVLHVDDGGEIALPMTPDQAAEIGQGLLEAAAACLPASRKN